VKLIRQLPDDLLDRENVSKTLLILVAVAGAFVLGGISTYNGLVGKQQGVDAAWAQVSNQYQRRADLVPNLVKTVQGSADFEKTTLENVVNARASVGRMTIDASKAPETAQQLEEFQKAQGSFGSALQRLLVVSENYPDLKASAGFRDLQAQLEGTENRITVARNRYIAAVKDYNILARSFPSNLTAMVFGYAPKANFTVANEAAVSAPPKVDFGK